MDFLGTLGRSRSTHAHIVMRKDRDGLRATA